MLSLFADTKKEYFAKGREEGLEKGEKRGLEKVAANMLRSGWETDAVSQATTLDQKQVEAIKKAL